MAETLRSRLADPVYLRFKAFLSSPGHYCRLRRGDASRISAAPVVLKRFLVPRNPKHAIEIDYVFPTRDDVLKSCEDTFSTTGIWPLSFSYPKSISLTKRLHKTGYLSPVFPGHKYSFSDEGKYLGHYSLYEFALTHKKAGWDCFRHLEILHSGSVPYMPDAELIPPHSMVHYPKAFLAEIARSIRAARVTLTQGTTARLQAYFNENLTSRAMADYVLNVSQLSNSSRLLFVDQSLAKMPDYLSVFTLVGLKQLLGKQVHVSHPVPYVYDDWNEPTSQLYGRGFGYAQSLPNILKTDNELAEKSLPLSKKTLS